MDDVLLQTVVTLVNLAGRRLSVPEEKDLEQARMGIEAVRALLPLCPQEEIAPVRDALSRLQLLYVREAEGRAAAPEEAAGEADPEAKERAREAEERAKARAKIWTPPGAESS